MSGARKGHLRRADIPPALLERLNAGEEETVSLVEWLAIDFAALLGRALDDVGLRDAAPLVLAAHALRGEGVVVRMKAIGRLLHAALREERRREKLFEGLASHRSDTVRAWAAFAVSADDAHPLPARLALMKRFAADRHMNVREWAWMSLRPHLAKDLPRGLERLVPWARDADENVRRCAIEATRPRGVWCEHLEPLKRDPSPALPLLEAVRADTSRYVQRSLANWLNDASRSQPEFVKGLCARWLKESPVPETRWIANHATRTLRKGAGR